MKSTTEATRAPRARWAPIETESYRPPYLVAGLAALAVWSLYVLTLAPTTAFWDTSEYIATAHILGIPHPPGNPLFVILARSWDILLSPTGLPVAVRINLFSATMSALAHGFWFLLAHRILAYYSPSRVFRLTGAALAVLLSATAFTVWNQSNVNEKVYTVSLLTIALLSWLAFRWRDNLGRGKDDNLLILMVFILALSVGNHLMAFLAAPALFVFVLLVSPRTLANWRIYALAAAAAVVGLSVQLFLPIRAALDPVINEAAPTCPSLTSAVGSILTFGRAGCEALSDALARRQYLKPSVFANPIDPQLPRDFSLFVAQLGNYLQYFDWQWARSIAGNDSLFGGVRPLVTLVFAGLGIYGAITHYRHDRRSWAYVAVLYATLSVALVFYLNFRYGYSYARDRFPGMEMHEVRERDYFFIASFSVWGVWAGIGLAALWRRLAERVARSSAPGRRPYAVTAPVLVLGLIPLVANWSWASRAHDYAARDWAYNLLMSVEPYGVLFTNGDNDTFPLWYLQEVEGIRRDVTVIVMSYLNTPWYVKQIQKLTTPCAPGQDPNADPTRIICQRPYEADHGPAFYRPLNRPPTRSIIQLTEEQIDQIANTPPFATRDTLVFRASNIETTLPPNTVMIPADIFLTGIVATAIGDRPIYFASTTDAYNQINLGRFLIRQGVAYKLHDGPVPADSASGIVALGEGPLARVLGPHVDLPRTDSLLWNVFVHRPGFPDSWEHWVDEPTQGIPYYYAYAHYAAAEGHARQGAEEEAQRHIERARAWERLGQR